MASYTVSLRKVQQDCGDLGGHRSKPRGWGNSAGELAQSRDPLAECGQSTGAHTSGVGETAGTRATGGRTGNIAGILGPRSPVDVPAALRECWGRGLDLRAGTPRKELAGDRPKDRRAPSLRTGLCVRYPLLLFFFKIFFYLGGDLMYFFHWTFIEREVVVRILGSR